MTPWSVSGPSQDTGQCEEEGFPLSGLVVVAPGTQGQCAYPSEASDRHF